MPFTFKAAQRVELSLHLLMSKASVKPYLRVSTWKLDE